MMNNNCKPSQKRAWYTVFISAIIGCAMISTFPQFSMTVTELSAKSGLSESVLLTSDTIKSIGIVLGMMSSGFLYNRFGAKKVFIFSVSVMVIPQFILPMTSQVWLLMLLKIVQGLSGACFPVFLSMIMEWVDKRHAGISTATFNGIFYAGGGLGGTLAGFIIANSNWQSSYYVISIILIVLSIIWIATVKEKPNEVEERETSIIHSTSEKAAEKSVEISDDKISGKTNLLFTGRIWLLAISLIATTWVVQAISVDMPVYTESLGYSEVETGKILTAVSIGILVSCLVSGKTSDFFAARSERKDIFRLMVLVLGYVITIAAVLFLILSDTQNIIIIYIAALLLTFGGAWGFGSFYSVLPEIYDQKSVPIVTGITGGIGDAGMPFAPLVVGVIFGIKGMWEIGWITCAIVAGISIISTLILAATLKRD